VARRVVHLPPALDELLAALVPPLTDTARDMLAAVERDSNDDTVRLACIDALDECGAHYLAQTLRVELIRRQFGREIIDLLLSGGLL
jgi:uncharacterized protein (TIGR02996 family)